MKKIILSIFLLSVTPSCLAEYDRTWLELGRGFWDSENVRFKIGDSRWGWAISYSKFSGSRLLTSYVNKHSQEILKPAFKTVAVSRFLSGTFGWGYADVGIGLAYGKGTWTDNCEYQSTSFVSRYHCDEKEGNAFGIPLHGSAALGKYAGIGLYADIFWSPELDTQGQIGITIPIGKFTR